jgi:coatomer protein complex subunit gamma
VCEILNCSIFIDVDYLKRFIIILFGNFHIIYADYDLNILQVAMTHPMAVTNCNIDMESLISDQNRSIATLAITTLLKTGNESSVDRLMKQITNFMSDIADEFKIVVVEAIRSLCLKFPLKYRSL